MRRKRAQTTQAQGRIACAHTGRKESEKHVKRRMQCAENERKRRKRKAASHAPTLDARNVESV
jgi:hypothetical protein